MGKKRYLQTDTETSWYYDDGSVETEYETTEERIENHAVCYESEAETVTIYDKSYDYDDIVEMAALAECFS